MKDNLENLFIDYSLFEKYNKNYFIDNIILPLKEDELSLSLVLCKESKVLDTKEKFLKILKFKEYNKEDILFILGDIDIRIKLFSLSKLFFLDSKNQSLEEFFFYLFSFAIKKRASDIHLESYDKKLIFRFRIDGVLKTFLCLNDKYFEALSSYLKLLSNLDITQKRLPQDGRFTFEIKNSTYDFRFSSMPTLYKESIVLRILDDKSIEKNLDSLGFNNEILISLKEALSLKEGLILVSGPTGSGKTTTLYSILNHLKSSEKKIISIEDPVEYKIDYINQVPVNKKINLSFEKILKNVLRQDPDIILIGEIRDKTSLNIALEASLTGHLVFASIHSNSALETISRLFDLKAQAFLLSSSLKYILAQRLVLVFCPYCKGKKCKHCNYTSYLGRETLSEYIKVDEKISSLISKKEDLKVIRKYLEKTAFKSLLEDGELKVKEKRTSLKEVLKVVYSC